LTPAHARDHALSPPRRCSPTVHPGKNSAGRLAPDEHIAGDRCGRRVKCAAVGLRGGPREAEILPPPISAPASPPRARPSRSPRSRPNEESATPVPGEARARVGWGNVSERVPWFTPANEKIHRDPAMRAAFRHDHPCPSTGRTRGACPGYEVDHVIPLACGGADDPSNMQWLTKEANRAKGSGGCRR